MESVLLLEPRCAEISPYILTGLVTQMSMHYIVLDNNALSDLAALAKNSPTEFNDLMASNAGATILIPEKVFEESIYNLQNERAVTNVYYDFYKILSNIIPIYIVTTDDSYHLFEQGFTSSSEAILNYIELAKLSTNNLEILNKLALATKVEDVHDAYNSIKSDAGERFAFLYIHAMLMDGMKKITFLSNEIKGVFNVWRSFSKFSALLDFIKVANAKGYITAFKVQSYNVHLFEYLRTYHVASPAQCLNFLKHARDSKIISRKIQYYSTELKLPYNDEVTNASFSEMVADSTIIMVN